MDSKAVMKQAKDLQSDLDYIQAQAQAQSETVQRDWLSPVEAAGLRGEIVRLAKLVETQKAWARSFGHRLEQEKQKTGNLERQLADARLSLATLCDMVLGLDASDRSDKALIRAVGKMMRQELQPCGHPVSAIRCNPNAPVTTNWCGWCADIDQARQGQRDMATTLVALRAEAQAELARIEQHGGEVGFALRILVIVGERC
jgi:hypothetical protein